jgi:hypothetical protein
MGQANTGGQSGESRTDNDRVVTHGDGCAEESTDERIRRPAAAGGVGALLEHRPPSP